MKTVEKKKDPELALILTKIRLLGEDEAYDVLESYAKEHADKRCENCMHSYHNKSARGYHDVEEFYKD